MIIVPYVSHRLIDLIIGLIDGVISLIEVGTIILSVALGLRQLHRLNVRL